MGIIVMHIVHVHYIVRVHMGGMVVVGSHVIVLAVVDAIIMHVHFHVVGNMLMVLLVIVVEVGVSMSMIETIVAMNGNIMKISVSVGM